MSNLSSIPVGAPGHKQVGSGSTVVSGSHTFKMGGPNSTIDSSEHRYFHGTQNSTTSMASRRVPTKEPLSNKPAILDKNKLKLILDNLRNDHPQNSGMNQHNRPRYLNTIESEGNLPT